MRFALGCRNRGGAGHACIIDDGWGDTGHPAPSREPAGGADAGGSGPLARGRHARTVGDVPFSFRVPASGWQWMGRISINKSVVGPQGAEAVIFWTSFPDGDYADPCANLRPVRRSAAELAAAVARAPGTEVVTGPSDVTVGGRAAKHVKLRIRQNLGCDPGFFFTWQAVEGGALWLETNVGDTIRVWIVDVEGTRLFIEAETTRQASLDVEREIQEIVDSIRFD